MPRCGVARSYGSSILTSLRNIHTVVHSSCTNLHPFQQYRRVPFSIHSPALFIDYLIMTILSHMKWYLSVVLTWISLIIGLSIFSCAWPSIHLLEKCLFRSSAHFFIALLFFWHRTSWTVCILYRLIPCHLIICEYFLPLCELSVFLFYCFLSCAEAFKFNYVHLFVFIFIILGGWFKNILLRFTSESVLPVFPSKYFIVSGLRFMSLIHSEFIFVYGVREYSDFIFLNIAVWFSQHHLLKGLSFLHCICLSPLL